MVPRDKWYMKWVYLNNLRNICFICYFIYLNLNEILFLIPNTFLPRVQRSYNKKKIWCIKTQLECDVTLSVRNGSHFKLFLNRKNVLLMNCVTVPDCRREKKKHVTTVGLCLSLYLATLEAKRGSLYFLAYCMLVALFYQLFMKKCERDILTEIKKEHIMKSDSETLSRAFLVVVGNAACKAMDICLYQTGGSHLNLTPRRHLSVLAACVWVRVCERANNMREGARGGGTERVRELLVGRVRRVWRGCGSCTFWAHL